MIKLIVGKKGTGKTKMLIDLANRAAETSEGNVVCIEKGTKLTFDINHTVRLVNSSDFALDSYEELYGLISGMIAANYDVTDIFVDSINKILGYMDNAQFEKFLDKIKLIVDPNNIKLTITVSADESELSDAIKTYLY